MKTAYRLIKEFEDSVRQHEIKGSRPAEDWFEINYLYKTSRESLIRYIKMLKNKPTISKV